jgi:putative pyruvate formate lyase activating enzyme
MITRREFLIQGATLTSGSVVFGSINPIIQAGMFNSDHKNEAKTGTFIPSYLRLAESGELERRWKALWPRMASCDLCPRECEKNRLRGVKGTCGADANVKIASYHPHFGEEKELVGTKGSGTIFLSNCAMRCVFCINHDISHRGVGSNRTLREFADMMLAVQNLGCHNLNLVTPTQYLPHILRALEIAAKEGLRIPIVYNTHGWEKQEMLEMLDGVVDIYLPDFKYAEPAMGSIYSAGADSYPEIAQNALLEMHRQTGVAIPDPETGLMQRGLMIRHLVMPNHIENSKKVIAWIAENLPKNTYVNIMSQYTPSYRAGRYPDISRKLTQQEYDEVISAARSAGLINYRLQG